MPQLIINTYVSLMYELKKMEKVFTSKFVGTGPSSCEKRTYRAAVSQRLRNTAVWQYIANVIVGRLDDMRNLTFYVANGLNKKGSPECCSCC